MPPTVSYARGAHGESSEAILSDDVSNPRAELLCSKQDAAPVHERTVFPGAICSLGGHSNEIAPVDGNWCQPNCKPFWHIEIRQQWFVQIELASLFVAKVAKTFGNDGTSRNSWRVSLLVNATWTDH